MHLLFKCFRVPLFNKGLGCKYIYQKNGDPSHISELLESFKKDARSVKLRAGKHRLEDVTGVLKRFLCDVDDALLAKELYPYWISALGEAQNRQQDECLSYSGTPAAGVSSYLRRNAVILRRACVLGLVLCYF